MGQVKVNQENESPAVIGNGGKKGGKTSLGTAKSLIPVPKAGSSPKNDENATPGGVKTQMSRKPLARVQDGETPGTPLSKKSTGKTVQRKSERHVETPKTMKTNDGVEKAVGTENLTMGMQLNRHLPGTPQNSPSKLRTRKSSIAASTDLKLKTDKKIEEKETIAYWKELAESRRQALDAALQENYELHKQVEELLKDKAELEIIAKEAEKLANMVTDAADEAMLDESGIGDSSEGTAV